MPLKLPDPQALIDAHQAASEANNYTGVFQAYLGKGDGVTVQNATANPPNTMVWYHTRDNRGIGIATLDLNIPYAAADGYYGLPVLVGHPPKKLNRATLSVFGMNDDGLRVAQSPNPANLYIQSATYPASSFIRTLRVEPQTTADKTIVVRGPWFYPRRTDNQPQIYADTTLDLTSTIGAIASGKHRVGVVYLNPDDGTLGIVTSADATPSAALPITPDFSASDVAALDLTGKIPCGALYLYNGQTAITELHIYRDIEVRSLFYPPRLQLNPSPAGTYTKPDSLVVAPDGRVTAITSGSLSGAGTLRTVKFSMSANQTITAPNVAATGDFINFNTSVTNYGSAGAWDGTKFTFTPPTVGIEYQVRLVVTVNAGGANTLYDNVEFKATVTSPSRVWRLYRLPYPWVAGTSFDTGAGSVKFTAASGDFVRPGVLMGFAGDSVILASGSYIEITWYEAASSSLTVQEVDTSPSISATVIEFPNGTLSNPSAGVARYTPGTSGGPTGYPEGASLDHAMAKVTTGTSPLTIRYEGSSHITAQGVFIGPAANGDVFQQKFLMQSGTYDFVVIGITDSASGKLDWTLDGSAIVTSQDWYSASTTYSVIKRTTSVTVTGSDLHTLVGTINGKNASSSDYYANLTKYLFVRTS